MSIPRILISWIGHTDLRAAAASLSPAEQEKILRSIRGGPGKTGDAKGPIKALLDNEPFDQVHLLSNYGRHETTLFARWLGCKPVTHAVQLENPTDYAAIFAVVDEVLGGLAKDRRLAGTQLCMYLSPGTPAMAAIWVLLGKTRYPATFYQSHEGRSWKTEIPFDVTLDVVPQLLRDPDAHLQHLAAESPKEVRGFEGIIGDSKSIRLAAGRAKRASVRDVSVFILGESGTGKEMFARAIHEASPRRGKTFIAINCAAIPEQLLESELLGHVKGSFTGAIHDRQGAFEKADGGTLFLDEIGECSSTIQVKLLRVLQPPPGQGPCCRRFMRLGETQERQSNVRVIAATNCNLHEAISQNRFREDLYYRLAVITLTLPPLRERKADIPLIAEALLAQVNRDFAGREPGYQDKTISVSANAFLKRQDWPGNVRQLYNVLLQAAVMSEGDVIEPSDLAASMAALPGRRSSDLMGLPLGDGFSLEDLQEKVQRHYLQRAMVEAGGRKTAAAKLLGMRNYQTLDAQLKRLGVKVTGE